MLFMQGLPVPFIQVRQFVVVMCLLVFFPKRKVKYPGCAFTLEHVPDEGKGGCMGQGCPAPLLHMELPWALGGTHCIPLHWLKQQVPRCMYISGEPPLFHGFPNRNRAG